MYETICYKTPKGNSPIADFLDSLRKSNNPEVYKALQLMRLLNEHGPDINLYISKGSKKIREEIYELRSGNIRIFYTHLGGGKYLLLHGFIKKRNDTPKGEINLAIKERKIHLKSDL